MSKRKHTDYTLHSKADILRRHIDGKEKIINISKQTGIPPNTISTWKSQQNKIFAEVAKSVQPQRKRMRFSCLPNVEKALLYWIRDMRSRDKPPLLDGQLIMEKAEVFASQLDQVEWSANRGWLYRFCRRYGIISKRICGQSLDCPDTETYVSEVLLPLLSRYNPEDIYNADETSFFFKMLPQRTYAFKNERVFGGKMARDRLTLMVCTNMDGSD